MKGSDRLYQAAVVASCAALLGVLVYVEFRGHSPEWKVFQEKGIALSIQRLEHELSGERSSDKKKALLNEVESLRQRKPEIVEIRPFGGKLGLERCLTCHFGIEDLSQSHPNSVFGCVICHGGNGPDLTVKGAHLGLRGGRNPARLDLAAASCGSSGPVVGQCHSGRENRLLDRVENVPRSLMATCAGIIGILRFQWGLQRDSSSQFGVRAVSDGKTALQAIPPEKTPEGVVSLVDSHFRKFCASCHLWTSAPEAKMGRLDGCPACHAPYGDDGRYRGSDPTVNRNEVGHAATHSITNRVPDDRCRACHNRSGRVGLNYHGEMESEQYGTPFVRGGLNNYTISDERFVHRLVPDVHYEKGMGCIDCHTGQDTMGDGAIHRHMKDQIEIRCEDCHGSGFEPPCTTRVKKDDPLVQALIRTSPLLRISDGDEILQTSKGRPLPHIKKTDQGFRLTSKLTGKEHPVSVITGKQDGHRIKGHERLECDTCHSAWSPQCYGCHQLLDFGHQGRDHISKKDTPGRWAEGRSHFRFSKNILGINPRGRVGILVPGCQVWNTVVDSEGKVVPPYDSKIMRLQNGLTGIAVGATHPHTTRAETPRCIDCHFDPKALGLGQGRLTWGATKNSSASGGNETPSPYPLPSREGERFSSPPAGEGRVREAISLSPRGRGKGEGESHASDLNPPPDNDRTLRIDPIYDSLASGLKIDFPLEAVVNPAGEPLQSTSHELARPFNAEEIRKITAIVPCLTCHDRYNDPVWQRPGPYKLTPACQRALR